MKMRRSLFWIGPSVTLGEAYGLGDPQPQGVLLGETAVPQGKKNWVPSPVKHLNPTAGKPGQKHTTKGCIIIFWISA